MISDSSLSSFRIEIRAGVQAAHRGLELADSRIGAGEISPKEGRDVVTASDVAVEALVRRLLHESVGQPVVGEEQGGARPTDGSGYWLVDPICGTRNFASSIPLFAVNVALVEGEHVNVAAVGDGSTGELYIAERGKGAISLNDGTRRRLIAHSESKTVCLEGWPVGDMARRRAGNFANAAIARDTFDFRSLGTSLVLAYLAAGRVSGSVLFSAESLHVGAGVLLSAEAGAIVTDLDGRPWTVNSTSIIAAASRPLHAELSEMARSTSAPQKS